MVSFYAFSMTFIETVLFKKGTLIKRAGVRTPWTPPGSAPGSRRHEYESGFAFTCRLSLVQASPARVERSRSLVQAHNSTRVY